MNNTEDMKMACSKEIYLSREACLKRWIQDYAAAIVQTCMYLTPDREKAEAAVQNTEEYHNQDREQKQPALCQHFPERLRK